jgi:hypothetical protein
MARKDARNVNPRLSSDPRDKLLAALNWVTGKWRAGDDYQRAPMYFDAEPCLGTLADNEVSDEGDQKPQAEGGADDEQQSDPRRP